MNQAEAACLLDILGIAILCISIFAPRMEIQLLTMGFAFYIFMSANMMYLREAIRGEK